MVSKNSGGAKYEQNGKRAWVHFIEKGEEISTPNEIYIINLLGGANSF